MILLPDTHFFLHFRDAPELPWDEITSDDEVRLVVCRTIQREIDRKEHELRGRPQKRARKFAGLIGEIGVNRMPLVLRASGPRVTLDYVHRRPEGWQPPSGLSEGWGDDMMVADALAFMAATGDEAAVLTNDVGVYRTAEEHGVGAILLRGKDHWQLPAEADELTKLKTEISELRRSGPAINLAVQVGDVSVKEISIEDVRFSPLDVEQIQKLIEQLRKWHPLVTDFSKPKPALFGWDHHPSVLSNWMDTYEDQAPTEEEIRIYTDESYPMWLQGAQAYLESLSEHLNEPPPEVQVTFLLSNQGTVPAEAVILEFEALGGVLLAEQSEKNEKSTTTATVSPPPPDAPSWKRVRKHDLTSTLQAMGYMSTSPGNISDQIGDFAASAFFEPTPERKSNEFYWSQRPRKPSEAWSFVCEDFRHQAKPEYFRARILVQHDEIPNRRTTGVRVRLSARNMRDAFEEVVPVRINVREGDTEAEALKLMRPKSWASRLRALRSSE